MPMREPTPAWRSFLPITSSHRRRTSTGWTLTNASYYSFDKNRYVLARVTRFGYMRSFGADQYRYIPLPERLYAGGAQSLRGFSINSAGPRDSLTGFPIGGAGAFVNNTELRLPSRRLPYLADSLGFVFFHDMGNVFNNSSDIWPSFLRTKQPHSWTCKILDEEAQSTVTRSSSTNPTGLCDFQQFFPRGGIGPALPYSDRSVAV